MQRVRGKRNVTSNATAPAAKKSTRVGGARGGGGARAISIATPCRRTSPRKADSATAASTLAALSGVALMPCLQNKSTEKTSSSISSSGGSEKALPTDMVPVDNPFVATVPPPLNLFPTTSSTSNNNTGNNEREGENSDTNSHDINFENGDDDDDDKAEDGDDDVSVDLPPLRTRASMDSPISNYNMNALEYSPGVNDYAAETYDFNQQIHHYMEYQPISTRNFRAVEYCCMVEANTIVYNREERVRGHAVDRISLLG